MRSCGWTVFRAASQTPEEETGLFTPLVSSAAALHEPFCWSIPVEKRMEGAFYHLSSLLFTVNTLTTQGFNIFFYLDLKENVRKLQKFQNTTAHLHNSLTTMCLDAQNQRMLLHIRCSVDQHEDPSRPSNWKPLLITLLAL